MEHVYLTITSHPVLVPLHTALAHGARPLSQNLLLVGRYWQTIYSWECDHPLLLLAVEVEAYPLVVLVLLVLKPVELLKELLLYPDLPSPPHSVNTVVRAGQQLLILLVEPTAAAEEESVLILDCVESKDRFVRGSEADAGVAAPALGVLTLTGALGLTNWNARNDHPGPALWFYSV